MDIAAVVILILVGFAVGFLVARARCCRSSAIAFLPDLERIEFGKTRISELYGGLREKPVLGFVDPRDRCVFVLDSARDRVRQLFRAKPAGDSWLIEHPSASKGEYRVVAMTDAHLERTIDPGLVFAIKDRECVKYSKGTCVNFYAGEKFAYSWKAIDDTWICTPTSGKDCVETQQANTVTLYPEKDCKGTSYQSTEKWNFCSPV